jgi:hypothetical protein
MDATHTTTSIFTVSYIRAMLGMKQAESGRYSSCFQLVLHFNFTTFAYTLELPGQGLA